MFIHEYRLARLLSVVLGSALAPGCGEASPTPDPEPYEGIEATIEGSGQACVGDASEGVVIQVDLQGYDDDVHLGAASESPRVQGDSQPRSTGRFTTLTVECLAAGEAEVAVTAGGVEVERFTVACLDCDCGSSDECASHDACPSGACDLERCTCEEVVEPPDDSGLSARFDGDAAPPPSLTPLGDASTYTSVELQENGGSGLLVTAIPGDTSLTTVYVIDLATGTWTPIYPQSGYQQYEASTASGSLVSFGTSGETSLVGHLDDGRTVVSPMDGSPAALADSAVVRVDGEDGSVDLQPVMVDRSAAEPVLELGALRTVFTPTGTDALTDVLAITPDGRHLLVGGTDLVSSDTNGGDDLYLVDTDSGEVTQLTDGDAERYAGTSLSDDGSVVALHPAQNEPGYAVPGEGYGPVSVTVGNRGTIESRFQGAHTSRDGRYTTFVGNDPFAPLVDGFGTFSAAQAWVYDSWTARVWPVSLAGDGVTGADGHCEQARLSPSGRTVAFACDADNLAEELTGFQLYAAPNPLWDGREAPTGTSCHPAVRTCADDVLELCPDGEPLALTCASGCLDGEGRAPGRCSVVDDRMLIELDLSGQELVGLRLAAGGELTATATPDSGVDVRVTLCDPHAGPCDASSDNLATADAGSAGALETATGSASAPGDYYVLVDSPDGSAGPVTLVVTPPIACGSGDAVCDTDVVSVCNGSGDGPDGTVETACMRTCVGYPRPHGAGCLDVVEGSAVSDAATPLDLGTLGNGELPVEGEIRSAGDVDWVSFTLDSPKTVSSSYREPIHGDISSDDGLLVQLYADPGDATYLASGARSFGSQALEAGTYYIRIEAYASIDDDGLANWRLAIDVAD